MDCLSNDKLKCRKCMQTIIRDISDNENKKNIRVKDVSSKMGNSKFVQYKKEEPHHFKKCHSVARYNKENDEKLMITSKYNWWMAERIKRRQEDNGNKTAWPRKARFNNQSNFDLFDVKKPKFERWEKKLLDQLLSKTQTIQWIVLIFCNFSSYLFTNDRTDPGTGSFSSWMSRHPKIYVKSCFH